MYPRPYRTVLDAANRVGSAESALALPGSAPTFLPQAVQAVTAMSEFETFECRNCGRAFAALPEANAATKRLCSPACETAQLAVDG